MLNKRNVWYKCNECGEGSECYALLKGLNYNCTITAGCLSGDNESVWVESAPPKSDTVEAVEQPLTGDKSETEDITPAACMDCLNVECGKGKFNLLYCMNKRTA